jgi:hypothetical protein
MSITHALVADGTPLVDDTHWNDDHVVDLAFAMYARSSGDYTTSSASFSDIDGTNLSFTVTTGAHRVKMSFVGSVLGGATANQQIYLDVTVDGTRAGGAVGLVASRNANDTTQRRFNGSFTYLTDVLSAGSHTFKFQWAAASGTATIEADGSDNTPRWWVEETLFDT